MSDMTAGKCGCGPCHYIAFTAERQGAENDRIKKMKPEGSHLPLQLTKKTKWEEGAETRVKCKREQYLTHTIFLEPAQNL
jgi:hypothetical protein